MLLKMEQKKIGSKFKKTYEFNRERARSYSTPKPMQTKFHSEKGVGGWLGGVALTKYCAI